MCTLMSIKTKDGAQLTGRTNEFTTYYKSELIFRPKSESFPSSFAGESKFTWKNKYSFIHQNAKGILNNEYVTIDGMNEKGVSISLLYFHYHEYKELEIKELKEHNVSFVYFSTYILGNFASVDEIRKSKEKLEDIFYWVKGMSQAGLGQHFSIVDASGDSIVIEPERKQILIKENPLKVLTNSSPLEYHYENLRQYSHLVSKEVEPTMGFAGLGEHKLLTQGNGLFGLPGDFTANSRFVRAAILSTVVDEYETADEGATILFRMLNTSDVVPGFITDELGSEKFKATVKMFPGTLGLNKKENTITDHTDNSIVKDLKNLILYYKTYDNITPRLIDFKELVKNESKVVKISMNNDSVEKFQKVTLT